jgi:hypothetical protein
VNAHTEHSVLTRAAPGSSNVIQVETMGKGVQAVLIGGVILAALLAGMALTRVDVAVDAARKAERETRLQRLETDEMNVRLELAKIPRHQPGDSP